VALSPGGAPPPGRVMSADVHWDDRVLFAFCKQNEDQVLDVIERRAVEEARPRIPTLDLLRTRAPGEKWLLPPGALKASWNTVRDTNVSDGHRFLEIKLNVVYRFSRKRAHKIRPVLEEWLSEQPGRRIP
jgi:hypothetical protein